MYRTLWGALLTLMQQGFILIVALIGIIDLFNYKDPNIIQYTIFDKRTDPAEINFGDNYGSFVFGFKNGLNYEALDPRYGHIEMRLIDRVKGLTQISIDEVNKENFPQETEA